MAKRVAMVVAVVVVEIVGISLRICLRICLSSSISLSRPLTIVIMSSVATIIGIAVVVETIGSIPMATINNMAVIVETMVAIASAIEAVFGGRRLGFRCGLRLTKGKTNGQKAESGDCLMD